MPLRVLAISGSLRTGSFNRRLLALAKKIAGDTGAEVTEYDLRTDPLPIYDGDAEEAGPPPEVVRFKKQIEANDVILISSPEYNYSIPGGLKNALDWASRAGNSLKGKYGIIMGVSNGQFGTVRMQPDLRKVLGALDVEVLPQPQIHVGPAAEAFDESGALKNPKTVEKMELLIRKTIRAAELAKT